MNMMVREATAMEAAESEQAMKRLDGLHWPADVRATGDARTMPVPELAAIVVAHFRAHGHICNVLTHVSGAKWDRVEEAIRVILDPCAGKRELTPLAENIVELLCAERGVTGRIVKPYFETLLVRVLPADVAGRISVHVASLCHEQSSRRHERTTT